MGDQRFAVVYDPVADRFVLQDAPAPDVPDALPWHEWVLPPKSAAPPPVATAPDVATAIAGLALTAQRADEPATRSPTKRPRVRDYAAHFASANAQLPLMTDDCKQSHTRCITWNGEPLHVSVACTSYSIVDSTSQPPAAPKDATPGVQHVFELAQLARIRPFADGYRAVNGDCTFAALTSSSSSSSEDDEHVASSSTLSDDDGALRVPVFARGDCVIVRLRRRRFHGTVTRRIDRSSFYDVRAASGTLFTAVSALRMRLLPPETPPRPVIQHDFERGDRVLWVPAASDQQENSDSGERQQTYKARVLQRRSRSRFDIELRTGRVRCKVPSRELVPVNW